MPARWQTTKVGRTMRRRDLVVDVCVAAAFTAAAQYEIWIGALPVLEGSIQGPRSQIALWSLFFTIPLAARRLAPLTALSVMMVAPLLRLSALLGGQTTVEINLFETYLALLLMVYSTAVHTSGARSVAGAAIILAGVTAANARAIFQGDVQQILGQWIFFALAWVIGKAIRSRTVRNAELQAERDADIQAAVEIERAGIARELHDIVAHAVTLMVLQAGAARQALDHDPVRARDPLLAVEATGRDALSELRRLLTLLGPNSEPSDDGPNPGLSRLGDLTSRAERAGCAVDMRLEGDIHSLPAGLDGAAYRIIQEAVTNSLKHSLPTKIEIVVRNDADGLRIAVSDIPPCRRTAKPKNSGRGLIGMRERAAIYGGTVEVSPEPEGGLQIRAFLPSAAE